MYVCLRLRARALHFQPRLGEKRRKDGSHVSLPARHFRRLHRHAHTKTNRLPRRGRAGRCDALLGRVHSSLIMADSHLVQPALLSLHFVSWHKVLDLEVDKADQIPPEWAASTVSRWDRLLVFGACNLGALVCFVICFTLFPVLSLKPRKLVIL